MSKSIQQMKWYAIPPDNAPEGTALMCNWQIATETGELIVHEGDRDAVEHIVALHNVVVTGRAKAPTWEARLREAV